MQLQGCPQAGDLTGRSFSPGRDLATAGGLGPEGEDPGQCVSCPGHRLRACRLGGTHSVWFVLEMGETLNLADVKPHGHLNRHGERIQ